ncbi:hypothetical protein H6F88_32085 [Oculatella sp. FACHB-28]|nr:hypothetical protein [Oculatella sp. FACHB-28]
MALPAGTEMIASVDAISESGMVQLSVVAVITPSSDGNQVIEIPPGVLLIGGEEGEPLVAENRNLDRERIADMDLNLALMGALSQVGTLLNRPDHQTTMTSPYLSTTSIRNGDTNILGGIMQGAFDSLLEETQERQQREIEEILQRPHLWYIPSGEPLQILINSSFELSL